MFEPQRRSKVDPIPIAIIAAMLLLGAILAAPRIAGFLPSAGETEVPSTSRIRISFNQAMDKVSVEGRLSIQPSVTGKFIWEDHDLIFIPDSGWTPGSTVEVQLRAGARSRFFLPILRSESWTFDIRPPRVAYLWPDIQPSTILARESFVDPEERLISHLGGILEYSVDQENGTLVYVKLTEGGGSELRALDVATREDRLLYACPEGWRCRAPAISPEMGSLAFERSSIEEETGENQVFGPPTVWVVDLDGGGGAFPVGLRDHDSSIPQWSPQGKLLYYDATQKYFAVVDPSQGSEPTVERTFGSELGVHGTWSPDGRFYIYPEISLLDPEANAAAGNTTAGFYSHIYRMNIETGLKTDLSEGLIEVEDSSPTYSPDGQWIAFTRKYLDDERWTQGRQLWIMRADGSQAEQLTATAIFQHGSLQWSPDSSKIAFMRVNQNDLGAPPEIWVYELPSGDWIQMAVGSSMPRWIP